MSSIYNKNGMIYISWYDFTQQKRLNKSLNLKNNTKNWKIAQHYKKQLDEALAKEKAKYKSLGIRKVTIADAFKHFLANNQSKHPKTIKDYNRFYMKFKETFKEDQSCTIITKLSIENWLNEIKKLPMKKNSIFGYYKQLNHFLNFLFEYNYVPMFKINRDVKPKVELVEKVVMTLEDLAYVFGVLKLLDKTQNFKRLIFLLYYTGLRASDLISIEIQNVDIERRVLKYYSPKRKLFREIVFHEDLIPVFQSVLNQKTSGSVLDYKSVEHLQRAINRFFEIIGLRSKGYTSRTFRKTFITIARKREMDESVVKELVGHAHSSTTDRFYHLIDSDQMIKELGKYLKVESLPYDKVLNRIKHTVESISNRKSGEVLK